MSARLRDKVAVVTGCGGPSIGRGCVLAFGREGAHVVGCDNQAEALAETEALCGQEGLSFASFVADLTDPVANEALMAFAVDRFGGLDILMNCAAFVSFVPIAEMDYEKHWRRTMVGELDLVFLACEAAWRHLVSRGGGSIINMASANAHVAHPMAGATAHCATKGGVLAMTRQLAAEGAPYNIRANTISPALIVTQATMEFMDAEPGRREALLDAFLLKRFGRPEDIGYCAVYLASDESSWVTGTDIRVDGGATAF